MSAPPNPIIFPRMFVIEILTLSLLKMKLKMVFIGIKLLFESLKLNGDTSPDFSIVIIISIGYLNSMTFVNNIK
jgi:hypothetical protein